jgi:hypothetical protein
VVICFESQEQDSDREDTVFRKAWRKIRNEKTKDKTKMVEYDMQTFGKTGDILHKFKLTIIKIIIFVYSKNNLFIASVC